MITSSPAFQQNGLLIITFDESVGDSTACCGEKPGPYDEANNIMPGGTGPGGGIVGAVLLSPYIAPGTKSSHPLQPLLDVGDHRGPVRATDVG